MGPDLHLDLDMDLGSNLHLDLDQDVDLDQICNGITDLSHINFGFQASKIFQIICVHYFGMQSNDSSGLSNRSCNFVRCL